MLSFSFDVCVSGLVSEIAATILAQSYAASLSPFLTVQQLQPTFRDVDEIVKSGVVVGYQHGSFTHRILKQIGSDDSQLRVSNSPEEDDHLLTLGTRSGGTDVAFDEIPYLQLLLSSYCSKYTTIGSTFKTEGFGFAFPTNSPLVPGISRAILNVTENHSLMKAIEEKWFKNITLCQAPSAVNTCYSLGLDNFLELFLIAGEALYVSRHWPHFLTQLRLLHVWDKICHILLAHSPQSSRCGSHHAPANTDCYNGLGIREHYTAPGDLYLPV